MIRISLADEEDSNDWSGGLSVSPRHSPQSFPFPCYKRPRLDSPQREFIMPSPTLSSSRQPISAERFSFTLLPSPEPIMSAKIFELSPMLPAPPATVCISQSNGTTKVHITQPSTSASIHITQPAITQPLLIPPTVQPNKVHITQPSTSASICITQPAITRPIVSEALLIPPPTVCISQPNGSTKVHITQLNTSTSSHITQPATTVSAPLLITPPTVYISHPSSSCIAQPNPSILPAAVCRGQPNGLIHVLTTPPAIHVTQLNNAMAPIIPCVNHRYQIPSQNKTGKQNATPEKMNGFMNAEEHELINSNFRKRQGTPKKKKNVVSNGSCLGELPQDEHTGKQRVVPKKKKDICDSMEEPIGGKLGDDWGGSAGIEKRLKRLKRCPRHLKHMCEVCSKEDCGVCANCLNRSTRHQACKEKPKYKCRTWIRLCAEREDLTTKYKAEEMIIEKISSSSSTPSKESNSAFDSPQILSVRIGPEVIIIDDDDDDDNSIVSKVSPEQPLISNNVSSNGQAANLKVPVIVNPAGSVSSSSSITTNRHDSSEPSNKLESNGISSTSQLSVNVPTDLQLSADVSSTSQISVDIPQVSANVSSNSQLLTDILPSSGNQQQDLQLTYLLQKSSTQPTSVLHVSSLNQVSSDNSNATMGGTTIPNLELLCEDIIPETSKWKDIAKNLEISYSEIECISKESHNGTHIEECFRKVFGVWEKHCKPPYTWDTIVRVLESPNVDEKNLATKIRNKYQV